MDGSLLEPTAQRSDADTGKASKILFQGWLKKRAIRGTAGLRNWRNRYLLVFADRIAWHASVPDFSATAEPTPLGSMVLNKKTEVTQLPTWWSSTRKNLLSIKTDRTMLVVQALNDHERLQWYKAIKVAVAPRLSMVYGVSTRIVPLEETADEAGTGHLDEEPKEDEEDLDGLGELVGGAPVVASEGASDQPEEISCFASWWPYVVLVFINIVRGAGMVVLAVVERSGTDKQLFSLWRETLSSVSMFIFAGYVDGCRHMPKLKDQPLFIATGLVYFLPIVLTLYLLSDMNALPACLLQMQLPVGVVVMAALVKRERFNWSHYLAMILSNAGLFVIFIGGFEDGNIKSWNALLLWIIVLLSGGAVYILIKKCLTLYPYATATAWFYMYCSCAILISIFITHDFSQDASFFPTRKIQWFCLFYKVYLSSMLVYLAGSWAMTKIPLHLVSALDTISPIVGALLSVFILDDPFTAVEVFGSLFLTGGMVLALFAKELAVAGPAPAKKEASKQPRASLKFQGATRKLMNVNNAIIEMKSLAEASYRISYLGISLDDDGIRETMAVHEVF